MIRNKTTLRKNNLIPLKICGVLFFLFILTCPGLASKKIKITILHTNDTHSQIEPSEKSNLKTSDMGGYARRMGVINKIRSEEKNVILLDAGDFSQGTPYFNFYNGRIEVDGMNRMKYDAGTIGNHEFDNGIDTLAAILKKAKYPILSSNYLTTETPLGNIIKPYTIINLHGLRIGIMALNVEPQGLIIESNYKGLAYQDPVAKADEISGLLKKKKKCDIIICLSHLGTDTTKNAANDFMIAHKTRYIDVIISGHSHNLITNTTARNIKNRPVIIAQMAKAGFYLGRIDLELEKK